MFLATPAPSQLIIAWKNSASEAWCAGVSSVANPVSRMTISGLDGIFVFLRPSFFSPSDPSGSPVFPESTFVLDDTTSCSVENPPWIPPGSLTRMFPG